MSKHSHSFHTNSQASQSTSFFDTIPNSEFFWKKKSVKEETEWSSYPIVVQNEFHIRNKRLFREWDISKLTLKNNFLIQTKKKNSKFIEYIDLEEHMYRMEVITSTNKKYSPKYPHAFSLYANGKSMEFFCKDKTLIYDWFCYLRKYCILANFHENYKISEVIGSGGYGKVHILESAFDENKFAGKFIKLPAVPNRDRQRVMIINEIRMLRSLNHPQIVKLFEVYEMAGQICLVMELVAGEKLFKYITGRRPLSEETSAYIVKQMLLILSYLKSQDIIHRDIKSENILYTLDDKGKIHLKLIDFGLGTYNKKRDIIKKCGTAGYVAPEILNNQPYNFRADLYSLGVIAYICLVGRPAFYARNYDELLEKNRKGIVKFKGNGWSRLSLEAQDLLQRMLNPDPFNRISLSEALSHEWLYKKLSASDRLDLSEYMFKVAKVNIPQEKNISKIPVTCGQIPFVEKAQALSSQTISSYQKLGTQSFLTSKLAIGLEDPKELNSFYKPGSKDGSYVSQLSLNVSHVSLSRSPSPHYDRQKLSVLPGRSLTVKLPNNNNSLKDAPIRHQTLKCEVKRTETLKLNKGYSIQISGAVSLDDLEMEADDEGSFCSSRYEHLLKHPFRFARITGKRNYQHSVDKLKLRAATDHTIRLDTDVETPRMKNKVAAVNKSVRDQIQFSEQELFV